MTEKSQVYSGVRDAFKKIYQVEGIRGLYRGFPISMLHVNLLFSYLSLLCKFNIDDNF